MTDLELQALTAEQTERRLQRVFHLTLGTMAFCGVYYILLFAVPFMGFGTELVHAEIATMSQEVAAIAIASLTSYVTGSAISGRR